MKYIPIILGVLLLAGCNSRSESEVLSNGMKWSLAQRELEQNGWSMVLIDVDAKTLNVDNVRKLYRYRSAKGYVVDVYTEWVGNIEKIDRISDSNKTNIEKLEYKDPPTK